jgi:hypothetical protein
VGEGSVIPQSLRRHMADTVTVAPLATAAIGALKTYGTAVPYRARIVHETVRLGADGNGLEVVSQTQVYLDRHVTIPLTSQLTLPARLSPRQPPILRATGSPAGEGGQLGNTVVFL